MKHRWASEIVCGILRLEAQMQAAISFAGGLIDLIGVAEHVQSFNLLLSIQSQDGSALTPEPRV